jgi:hypothetical protein
MQGLLNVATATRFGFSPVFDADSVAVVCPGVTRIGPRAAERIGD